MDNLPTLQPLSEDKLEKLKNSLESKKDLPLVQPSESEIEIKSIKELSKDKIYHLAIDTENTHPMSLRMFVESAKALDLKMFITMGKTTLESLKKTLEALPEDQKDKVLKLLGYKRYEDGFNPLDHEQSK